MRYGRILALLLALSPLALASCDGGNPAGSNPVDEDELIFLRAAEGAPALAAVQRSFWVKVHDGGEVEIPYVNGHECLEFKVPGDALLRKPDGSLYARNDSVLITVRVVDPRRFNFEFLPAGLTFRRDKPAELRVSYRYADRDFDGDGVIDQDDSDFDFGFYKQERDGDPWRKIGTARLKDLQELRADIFGFTKYAAAGE
jgi:hypothetical protein